MASAQPPTPVPAGTVTVPDPEMHPGHRYAHLYPTDAPTMPEKPAHDLTIASARDSIQAHLGPNPGPSPAYRLVSNVFLYPYAPDHPQQKVRAAPDLMLIRRPIDWPPDTSYLAWHHGPPDLVLEVVSKETANRDLTYKKSLYEAAGVREYWLHDPLQLLGSETPRLQAWQLSQGTLHGIQPLWRPIHDQPCALYPSEVLNAAWGLEDNCLRLRKPGTDTWYPLRGEVQALLEQAHNQAEQANARAEQANARAEQANARANREALARAQLEAELAALRAQMGQDAEDSPNP